MGCTPHPTGKGRRQSASDCDDAVPNMPLPCRAVAHRQLVPCGSRTTAACRHQHHSTQSTAATTNQQQQQQQQINGSGSEGLLQPGCLPAVPQSLRRQGAANINESSAAHSTSLLHFHSHTSVTVTLTLTLLLLRLLLCAAAACPPVHCRGRPCSQQSQGQGG